MTDPTVWSKRDPLLAREEAAEFLGVRAQTLAVWACTGRYDLPFFKIGGRVRYRLSDLERWLAQRQRTSTG